VGSGPGEWWGCGFDSGEMHWEEAERDGVRFEDSGDNIGGWHRRHESGYAGDDSSNERTMLLMKRDLTSPRREWGRVANYEVVMGGRGKTLDASDGIQLM